MALLVEHGADVNANSEVLRSTTTAEDYLSAADDRFLTMIGTRATDTQSALNGRSEVVAFLLDHDTEYTEYEAMGEVSTVLRNFCMLFAIRIPNVARFSFPLWC
jgi:hypothetical protein